MKNPGIYETLSPESIRIRNVIWRKVFAERSKTTTREVVKEAEAPTRLVYQNVKSLRKNKFIATELPENHKPGMPMMIYIHPSKEYLFSQTA